MTKRILIIIGLVCLLIWFLSNCNYVLEKKDASKQTINGKTTLRYPDFYRDFPKVFIILFLLILIGILIFAEEKWGLSLLILGVLIPIITVYIIFTLWQVEIQEAGFVYRNYFGITKEYQFCDLEFKDIDSKFSWGIGKETFFKDGKKVFSMPNSINGGYILKKIYKKYRSKTLNGKNENSDVNL